MQMRRFVQKSVAILSVAGLLTVSSTPIVHAQAGAPKAKAAQAKTKQTPPVRGAAFPAGPFNQSYCKTVGIAGVNANLMPFVGSTLGGVATLTGDAAQANPAWRALQLILELDVYPKIPNVSENDWRLFNAEDIEGEVNKCSQHYSVTPRPGRWEFKITGGGTLNGIDHSSIRSEGQYTYIRSLITQTRTVSATQLPDRKVYLQTYGFNCRQPATYVSSTFVILDREGDIRAASDSSAKPPQPVPATSIIESFQTAACVKPPVPPTAAQTAITFASIFGILNAQFPEFAPSKK